MLQPTLDRAPRLIADLQRHLAERKAELGKAQRNLNKTTTERDEALAREAATAEVLGVINASPGDLTPVFEAILEKATRLCDAAGILWIYDGTRFRAVAWHGVPRAFIERAQQRNEREAIQTESLAKIARGELVVRDNDLSKNRGQDAVQLAGMRTGFLVALRKGDAVLGAIRIFRSELRPFTDKQIELVENFAAQAVIAMENARLLTETREALEQQTATSEVLQVINSSPGDLQPVFDAMLDKAMALCEASSATLYTLEEDRARLVALRGASGVPEWMQQQNAFDPPPGSSIDRLRRGERFVHLFDATETEAYRASPAYRDPARHRRAQKNH